jgi:epoxyqueuosine reductase
MNPHQTAALLKKWALEEGFDDAGVATLGPVEHGEAFLHWLERGEHAAMAYLERRVEVRLDPSRIFPGARSVLCVAMRYHPLIDGPDPEGDLWPRVARYARGRDYHDVMVRRLQTLASRLRQAYPDCECRTYVDTGPVLERELAARAGLGALGKNTCLLHPQGGSWYLLGELFTSLQLAPDRPLADMCGTCTRCLEACPTGALPEPYRLDSTLCISYWTIEHRGAMPPATREMVRDWVFGCDICQEVCPWNDANPAVAHPEFGLPTDRAKFDLVGLLSMRREEYLERFRGSAMKRAKLEGLQRNAAVAMGNRREARDVSPLKRSLEAASPVVRAHAAWALGRIGGEEAERGLRRAAVGETEAEVRREIGVALEAASNSSVRDG